MESASTSDLEGLRQEAVTRAIAEARERWPAVGVARERFEAHVAALHALSDEGAALHGIHLGDLLLAWACLEGQAAALAAFEEGPMAVARAALTGMGMPRDRREEVLQQVRAKLLAATPEPRIARYGGTGSLASWVRVIAVRAALSQGRSMTRARKQDDELMLAEMARSVTDEPELDSLREQYREQLGEAMAKAFGELATDERNLLRMHSLDGVNLRELGKLHGVDASTVSRRLAKIRAQLLASARDNLAQRCGLGVTEVESLIRAVGRDVDLSVARLLESDASDG